jgi:DNA-binding XRE family transcriptional regulator
MQGDEMKAIRTELGMTQGEFADAIGVTPTFVGMMERGDKPIEKRTALAARQLYNERSDLYGGFDPGEYPEDVPLADAMIIWNHEVSETRPAIKVLFNGRGDDRRYTASYGACNSDWARADTVGQLLRLFSRIPEWTIIDGIPPREVHEALWVIPEYRASVAPDFAVEKGAR